jgi:hypothetical protein
MLRGAFIKALDLKASQEGKTLAEIMLDLIQAEGMLAVMDRIAKFQERTGTLDVNHKGVSLAEILTGITQGAGHDTQVEGEPDSVRH